MVNWFGTGPAITPTGNVLSPKYLATHARVCRYAIFYRYSTVIRFWTSNPIFTLWQVWYSSCVLERQQIVSLQAPEIDQEHFRSSGDQLEKSPFPDVDPFRYRDFELVIYCSWDTHSFLFVGCWIVPFWLLDRSFSIRHVVLWEQRTFGGGCYVDRDNRRTDICSRAVIHKSKNCQQYRMGWPPHRYINGNTNFLSSHFRNADRPP